MTRLCQPVDVEIATYTGNTDKRQEEENGRIGIALEVSGENKT